MTHPPDDSSAVELPALAARPPLSRGDRLMVHGLEFVGHHGVYDEEREHGRRFVVDVEVGLRAPLASHTDALDDTVDYRWIAEQILHVGAGDSQHLIERLATLMVDRLLAEERLTWVDLELRKYADGVPGEPAWVGIRVVRSREEGPSSA